MSNYKVGAIVAVVCLVVFVLTQLRNQSNQSSPPPSPAMDQWKAKATAPITALAYSLIAVSKDSPYDQPRLLADLSIVRNRVADVRANALPGPTTSLDAAVRSMVDHTDRATSLLAQGQTTGDSNLDVAATQEMHMAFSAQKEVGAALSISAASATADVATTVTASPAPETTTTSSPPVMPVPNPAVVGSPVNTTAATVDTPITQPGVTPDLLAAVLEALGPTSVPRSHTEVSATFDPGDRTWTRFSVHTAPGYRMMNGDQGLAHQINGVWKVAFYSGGEDRPCGPKFPLPISPSVLAGLGFQC